MQIFVANKRVWKTIWVFVDRHGNFSPATNRWQKWIVCWYVRRRQNLWGWSLGSFAVKRFRTWNEHPTSLQSSDYPRKQYNKQTCLIITELPISSEVKTSVHNEHGHLFTSLLQISTQPNTDAEKTQNNTTCYTKTTHEMLQKRGNVAATQVSAKPGGGNTCLRSKGSTRKVMVSLNATWVIWKHEERSVADTYGLHMFYMKSWTCWESTTQNNPL